MHRLASGHRPDRHFRRPQARAATSDQDRDGRQPLRFQPRRAVEALQRAEPLQAEPLVRAEVRLLAWSSPARRVHPRQLASSPQALQRAPVRQAWSDKRSPQPSSSHAPEHTEDPVRGDGSEIAPIETVGPVPDEEDLARSKHPTSGPERQRSSRAISGLRHGRSCRPRDPRPAPADLIALNRGYTLQQRGAFRKAERGEVGASDFGLPHGDHSARRERLRRP